jgi:O-Antigen ligase
MNKTAEVSQFSVLLDRAIVVWLFLFAIFAPHSIAATQTAWLIGMVLWAIRLFVYPPPTTYRTPIDYALLGFFILTGLSAFLSYQPMVSINKLRAASLFTIVYLFFENIRSLRVVRLLALTLIGSCMINVVYTAALRLTGRGIKVQNVAVDSPLSAAINMIDRKRISYPIISGDTLLEIDGQPVRNPEQVADALDASRGPIAARIKIYRIEYMPTLLVPRGHLLPGSTPEQRLGILGWSRGRDWRATGFYSHWVTYSEALQLIASLALGLFICLPLKRSRMGALLFVALAGLAFALLLTVTRASWLGFLVSACVMVLVGTSRRTIAIVSLTLIPVVLVGFFLLRQQRHVGFVDQTDQSITWRETVWREGFNLLISKPRHLLVGVGMDSIKSHWREWGLFDQGRIPVGHMHSDFLEIALERGVPALIVWLIFLALYARVLWRLNWRLRKNEKDAWEIKSPTLARWMDRGIALGALGGLAGFITAGFVHYNWGDSTVMEIFYFMMGLSLAIDREHRTAAELLSPRNR